MVAIQRDFPFYNNVPARLSAVGAAVILAGCGLGFAALLGAPHLIPGWIGRWLGVALFVLLPLLGLALATGGRWTAIFHKPTRRDVLLALAFVPPTFILPGVVGFAVLGHGLTSANPAVALLAHMDARGLAVFFASTVPQLLGEELVTILPFLVVLTAAHRLRIPRLPAIVLAWLLSALLFGALHLSTYEWRLFQVFVLIGLARLSLTASYIATKNLWASFITHIVNDWLLFGAVLGLNALAA